MNPGDVIGALLLGGAGIGMIYLGYVIRADGRADLVFAPGANLPDDRIARVGGLATILVGVTTIGLGLALFFVPATGRAGSPFSASIRLFAHSSACGVGYALAPSPGELFGQMHSSHLEPITAADCSR